VRSFPLRGPQSRVVGDARIEKRRPIVAHCYDGVSDERWGLVVAKRSNSIGIEMRRCWPRRSLPAIVRWRPPRVVIVNAITRSGHTKSLASPTGTAAEHASRRANPGSLARLGARCLQLSVNLANALRCPFDLAAQQRQCLHVHPITGVCLAQQCLDQWLIGYSSHATVRSAILGGIYGAKTNLRTFFLLETCSRRVGCQRTHLTRHWCTFDSIWSREKTRTAY
jgi:hypothetical protein